MVISFETIGDDTFVHMWSNGVLGRAKEIKERVPKGTWLTIPSKLTRLTPWLVKKCQFKLMARVLHDNDLVEILQKE